MPALVSLHKRFTELIPELSKFGLVGLIGSVIDLGGADYLHGAVGIGPMVSKGLSISAATLVTYLGSRFWTFRHRVNQAPLREGLLFVALNVVGLAIAECVIALITYGFGMDSRLDYNAASLAGTGLGTIFRYFSYKKWVFLAGAPEPAVARYQPAHAYQPSRSRARRESYEPGYGPPWEVLDAADGPRRPDVTAPAGRYGAGRTLRRRPEVTRGHGPAGCPCPAGAGALAGRPRTWRAWA